MRKHEKDISHPGETYGRDGQPGPNKWIVTAAIMAGGVMGAIDMSIVNVALPYIQSALGATVDEITWISTGYMISLVIVMPLTAWISGIFGRKRVYMFSLGLFILSSFFCGTSKTLDELIFFRVMQGVGAAALQPIQQAILRETFPLEEQGMAMAIYGVVVMIGPAVGPTLGGWITDNYSWPWIFFINLPIGVLGIIMAWRVIHDPPYLKNQAPKSFDYLGILTLAIGLATLQTVLEQGQRDDWFSSDFIATLTIASIVALTLFIYWELRVRSPVVDLRLFKSLQFTVATAISGILGVSLFSAMFLLPLFIEDLLLYNPMQTGMVLMPRAVAMIAMMPVSGLMYNWAGARKLILGGLLVAGAGGWFMSLFTVNSSTFGLVWPQILQGIGFSFIFVALSTAAFSKVPRERLTNAAGLYNLIRQLGGSFGVAIAATMMENKQTVLQSRLTEHITASNPIVQKWVAGLQSYFMTAGSDLHTAKLQAFTAIEGLIQQQSSEMAFEYVFQVTAVLLLLCLPLVAMLQDATKVGKSVSVPHPE